MIWLYLLGIIFELLILLSFFLYMVSLIYSVLRGSFYVSTKQKEIDQILQQAQLKKGQYLLEMGSGMGRVLRTAATKYGAVGRGVEINPSLNWIARLLARLQHLHAIEFTTDNVLTTPLKKADVIYIFLMPKLIQKFEQRLHKETKHGVLIISHAFRIDSLDKYLIKTITKKPFSTFFYKLP